MAVAIPAAVVLLKRRRIGAIASLGGMLLVAAGFFIPLTQLPAATQVSHANSILVMLGNHAVALPLTATGSATGIGLLHQIVSAPLLSTSIGASVVDVGSRAGVSLMALAALLCIVFSVLPLMRGFVGVMAGLGLLGTAIEMGVLMGEQMRTLNLCAGSACSVNLHAGIWLCALGFAVAMVGGAIGALRPLAGLLSGVSLTLMGVVLGAGLAYLVAAQHVLDVARAAVPH